MRSIPIVSLLLFLLMLLPGIIKSGTSAELMVVVEDEQGRGVADISLTITAEGTGRIIAEAHSEKSGSALFRGLPAIPVVVRAGGVNHAAETSVTLIAGRRIQLVFRKSEDALLLRIPANPEAMKVYADTATAESVTKEYIGALAAERDISALLDSLAGITSTDGSILLGADPRSGSYYVDGVDVTDPFSGTLALTIPYDSLNQLSLFSSSAPSMLNSHSDRALLIGTSPTSLYRNVPSGEVSTFFEMSDFPEDRSSGFFSRERDYFEGSVKLGGRLFDDRFGYFSAVSYTREDYREYPDRLDPLQTRKPEILLKADYSAGGSWTIRAGYTASLKKMGSLYALNENVWEIREPSIENVTADIDQNTQTVHAEYSHVSKENILLSAGLNYLRSTFVQQPSSGNTDIATVVDILATPPVLVEGSIEDSNRDDLSSRLTGRGSVSIPGFDLIGTHEFNIGAALEKSDMSLETAFNGGYHLDYSTELDRVYRRISYRQDGSDGISSDRDINSYRIKLADDWALPGGRIRLSGAVGIEKLTAGNSVDDVFDWTSVSPEIAIAVDPFGDRSLTMTGSWARRYKRVLGIHIPQEPYQRIVEYYDAASGTFDTSALNRTESFGFASDSIDEDIERPRVEETSLTVTMHLGEFTSFAVTALRRIECRFFEDYEVNLWSDYTRDERDDSLGNTYQYFVRQRGEDGTLIPRFRFGTMMDLRREFNGINAILETRHDDRLSLELRYSWSTTRGSIDTTLDESSGFSRIYDDPNERINSDGYLGSDIRHTLRMVAVYKAPYDISAAIYLRYESGAPLDRLLLNPDMGRYEIRGDERGSVYRKQAVSTIDLRLEKRIDLAGNHNLTVILDIFNLADDDAPVSYLVNDVEIGRPLQLREPRRFRWGLRYSF